MRRGPTRSWNFDLYTWKGTFINKNTHKKEEKGNGKRKGKAKTISYTVSVWQDEIFVCIYAYTYTGEQKLHIYWFREALKFIKTSNECFVFISDKISYNLFTTSSFELPALPFYSSTLFTVVIEYAFLRTNV